jgi:large subunit ribosomal protein L10
MSKYVKNLITDHIRDRLNDVNDLLVVNVIGLDANKTVELRRRFREKNISLLVVKNSLVGRATEGTVLAPAFEGAQGTNAIIWGSEDVVSLAKEVAAVAADKAFEGFEPRGGVMDGAGLSAEEVKQVAKWPSRGEQLSLLVGQILSPGASLQSQLRAPGGLLASQVKKKSEDPEQTS